MVNFRKSECTELLKYFGNLRIFVITLGRQYSHQNIIPTPIRGYNRQLQIESNDLESETDARIRSRC